MRYAMQCGIVTHFLTILLIVLTTANSVNCNRVLLYYAIIIPSFFCHALTKIILMLINSFTITITLYNLLLFKVICMFYDTSYRLHIIIVTVPYVENF